MLIYGVTVYVGFTADDSRVVSLFATKPKGHYPQRSLQLLLTRKDEDSWQRREERRLTFLTFLINEGY
jgi:hypothetical protein